MAAFVRIKSAIVDLVEAYFAGDPSNDIRKRQRAALGDAGTSAPYNTVEVDEQTMLAGSMFGFPLDPEDPEGSGPDPAWLDRTAIATLLTGLGPFLHKVTVHSTAAPGANEDVNDGYDPGSRWIKLNTSQTYTNHVNSAGAAVWVEDSGGGGGAGGDNITVNTVAVVDLDFDDATPAAPAGDLNIKWQENAASPAKLSGYIDVSALEPLVSHALLGSSSLTWGSSGHTGTANRVAGFDSFGATTYYIIGTNLQAWDADLDAVAALGTTGLVVRSGAATWITRTITGTNGITVTNGDGVAAAPNIALSGTSFTPARQIYDSAGSGVWQTWTRPAGHTMCRIVVIGAGGGGGLGRNAVLGVSRAGGGGGGAGGTHNWEGSAPATIEVLVGVGGAGAVFGVSASQVGERTITARSQSTDRYNVIVDSGESANAGGAGGTGTTAGGSGGAAETIATDRGRMGSNGVNKPIAGQIGGGGAPGAGGAAPTVTPQTTKSVSGGGGGGSCTTGDVDSAGGPIAAAGTVATVAGGVANGGNGNPGTTTGTVGEDAVYTGGTGGGGDSNGTGGTGGDGATGSGGGGAGAGISSGNGGRGGDGLVVIDSW